MGCMAGRAVLMNSFKSLRGMPGMNPSFRVPESMVFGPVRLHVIDAVMIFRENIRPEWEASPLPGLQGSTGTCRPRIMIQYIVM